MAYEIETLFDPAVKTWPYGSRLPVHATATYPRRTVQNLTRLVIHHTAGRRLNRPVSRQTVVDIARFHVTTDYLQKGGAPGIAYPFLVGWEGTVYKTWPVNVISWCVAGANSGSLCVAFIGNFMVEDPTLAQWQAGIELCRDLLGAYAIPAEHLYPHKGVPTTPPQSTACPGSRFDFEAFKAEVLGG